MPASFAPALNHTPALSDLKALVRLNRSTLVAISVVALHVLMLLALQSGLFRRAMEVIVPVQMLSEFVEQPASKAATVAPPKPAEPRVAKPKLIAQPSAPHPTAIADTAPAPTAPVGMLSQQPVPEAFAQPVSAAATEPAALPAPMRPPSPQLELPSSDADYLKNPPPVYPPMSKRLNEQGQVIHSVTIGIDGLPISARLVKSSGYDRLDQAAYKAVMGWRYTPGKRNGVVTAMAYNAPINWVLE